MSNAIKAESLNLAEYTVPQEFASIYNALSERERSEPNATELQREWRLATRLCHQFLKATKEPAKLIMTNRIGDWQRARELDEAPKDEYTFFLWLAAQAWRLLQCCAENERETLIKQIRDAAREGMIAVQTTSPSLCRQLKDSAQQDDVLFDDRTRGPQLVPTGKGTSAAAPKFVGGCYSIGWSVQPKSWSRISIASSSDA